MRSWRGTLCSNSSRTWKPSTSMTIASSTMAARAFGAGKELHRRLVETIPPLLLKFYGDSDARPPV